MTVIWVAHPDDESPAVSPRWDQIFLTVATCPTASGSRSRSRPAKTGHPVPKKSLCKCAASARSRPRHGCIPPARTQVCGVSRSNLDRPVTISSSERPDDAMTMKARQRDGGGSSEEKATEQS